MSMSHQPRQRRAVSLGFRLATLACALAGLAGCQTIGSQGLSYQPDPAEVSHNAKGLLIPGDSGALVAKVKARMARSIATSPAQVQVDVEIESLGDNKIQVNPKSMVLFDAKNNALQSVRSEPAATLDVLPKQTGKIQVWFELPPGMSVDGPELGYVTLRWSIKVNGQYSSSLATFLRR